jgi:MFS transporter, ACS family, solute carrier family 17 (sodium-dependent inorganic phosphate cotransporter), other
MGFLAIVNAYTMRICLNVAITEMTVKKYKNATDAGVCFVENHPGNDGGGVGGGEVTASTSLFEWNEELQGIILGAFFWGYVSRKTLMIKN